MFKVDHTALIELVDQKSDMVIKEIFTWIQEFCRKSLEKVLAKYKEILDTLNKVDENEEALTILENWLEKTFENEMVINEALFDNAMEIFNTYMDKDKCRLFNIDNYKMILKI